MFLKFCNENSKLAFQPNILQMKPYTKNKDEFPYIQDISPRQELKKLYPGERPIQEWSWPVTSIQYKDHTM